MTHAELIGSMVPQDAPELPDLFRRFGCRARCLMAIGELVTGRPLIVDEILDIISLGEDIGGVFDNESYRTGTNEHWLIDAAFRVLENNRRGAQIGMRDPEDGEVTYWRWVGQTYADKPAPWYTYILREYTTDGQYGLHWVVADRQGVDVYNPYRGPLALLDITRELLYDSWEART